MKVFALSLSVMTGADAPEGPGWYLVCRADDQYMKYRIDSTRAEDIGRIFEDALPVGDETISLHPFRVVKEGTTFAQEAVKKELEEAEAAATKIARLRRLQADLGGNTDRDSSE